MAGEMSNFSRLGYKLFPLGVNAYYRCPKKFHFRHIAKVQMPYTFKPAVAFGGVTHKVIAEQLKARKNGLASREIEDLALEYLKKEARQAPDLDGFVKQYHEKVVEHVAVGLNLIPDESEILAVEQTFQHRLSTPRLTEAVTLCAKVDLVFKHPDGTVEHVDFKTGKQAVDLFQNFICRMVVSSELRAANEGLVTSNVMTATGSYMPVNSSREANASVWQSIRDVIESIESDQEWRAKPEPAICRWCDFNAVCDKADLGREEDGWNGD